MLTSIKILAHMRTRIDRQVI